ncbi:MAG: 30S ribosomal protein S7 [Anaerolineae bacterium]
MRRKTPEKREVRPDAKYGNKHVTMFVNRLMIGGKKSTAFRIMYDAFDMIEDRMGQDPSEVFETALNNVRPAIEVKPRRVGGSTYQVPTEVKPSRGVALAMRWLIQATRSRSGRNMSAKLAGELMDAAQGQGAAVRRKDEVHKMAEANRAFAHFR